MMNMKLVLICLAIPYASAALLPSTQRENFDFDWKFARFGAMPDGSKLAEPGNKQGAATASSVEGSNEAGLAIDGKENTRWCAEDGSSGQNLTLHFGKNTAINGVEITWEKKANHLYRIETSLDGKKWDTVLDKTQGENISEKDKASFKGRGIYARLVIEGSNQSNWASIREISFLDNKGAKLKPVLPPTNSKDLPASASNFNDTEWRTVQLPHDWAIEGPFRMDLPNETGKLPWAGLGWYRKNLMVPQTAKGEQFFLDFDGVMARPQVYVNGELAGEWGYGYNSFRIDITPFLKYGENNVIAVRVENRENSSRWYPGAGIYRHVYLTRSNPVHLDHWGVFVTTPQIQKDKAKVNVETTVRNSMNKPVKVTIQQSIGETGKVLASKEMTIPAGGTDINNLDFVLPNPIFWGMDDPSSRQKPYLYPLITRILIGGKVVDQQTTPFGVRTAEWKSDGFYLNGKKVEINGVCQHHDLGPMGGASYDAGYERQVKILKSMGVNSIRCSHNPPSPEFLKVCDREGILVMDELFDMWRAAKKGNDYSTLFNDWHEKDINNFIKRDRNHPSVVAWSVGNEVTEQYSAAGAALAKELVGKFKKLDNTRAIAIGCDHPDSYKNGFGDAFDLFGFNYKPHLYKEFAKKFPDRAFVGSETSSCVSTRGEYAFPVSWKKNGGFFNFQVSSYDLYAPGWANRPDIEFSGQDGEPKSAGEYVWTGFDYLGEPTPYNQDQTVASNFHNEEERAKAMAEFAKYGNRAPSRSSYFGIVDLCGFPKDRYYLYQSRWLPDIPMAHILPHWTWQGREGQVTPVHVYSNGDSAELFINGVSQGLRKKGQDEQNAHRFVWNETVYQPGEVKVQVQKNGKAWTEAKQTTAGAPAKLQISTPYSRKELASDGQDLAYFTIKLVDAKGNLVPSTDLPLKFDVKGEGELVAVCNGDPVDHNSFQGKELKSFHGMAQAIVRSKKGKSGVITLSVSAPNLPIATSQVQVRESVKQ